MNSVAVVIPCYNGERELASCLTSVLANDYPQLSVVVVDDGSTDGSKAVFDGFKDSRLRWVSTGGRVGAAAARNLGVAVSESEFLFFTDVDCRVSPHWIRAGVEAFGEAEVTAVEGPLLYSVVADSLRYKMPVNPFYHRLPSRRLNRSGSDYAAGNIAYRRSVWRAVGGFRPCFKKGREDTDLAWRVRQRGPIRFCPRMRVVHAPERWTWRALGESAQRYEEDVRFFREHGFFFFRWGPVLHPRLLWLLLFPWLIPFQFPVRARDLGFLVPFWFYLGRLRWAIWRGAWIHRQWVV